MKTLNQDLLRLGALAALTFSAGCATTKSKPDQTAEAELTGGAVNGVDPLADVRRPPPGQKVRVIEADAQEDFEKAVTAYEKMKKKGIKPGDCDGAEEFEDIAAKHPNLPEARFNQAAALFECGKEADAIRIWEDQAGGAKPYSLAITNLAFVAAKRGDTEKAQTMFERSIQLDQKSNSVPARLNLALILRDKARQAGNGAQKSELNLRAQRELQSVLALDGSNLHAYAALAYLYYDLGLLDAAVLVGEQGVAKAQEIATGKTVEQLSEEFGPAARAGKRGKGKKDKDEATTAGKRAEETATGAGTGFTVDLKKQVASIYNTLGLVSLKKKNVSAAIANFKRAVENDPDLYEARLNWSALALNFRDYGSAEQNLRAVVSAQPKNYEAVLGLGVALRGQRKIDEAEQQYLSAQKISPERPEAYFNLGVLYQEYKGTEKVALEKAQQFFRDYISRSGPKQKEVNQRIKDIDATFAALEEAAKLQKEAEELQRQMEEQQKKAEDEAKRAGAAGAPSGDAPASAAPADGPSTALAK